jgi:hypothetical protein
MQYHLINRVRIEPVNDIWKITYNRIDIFYDTLIECIELLDDIQYHQEF